MSSRAIFENLPIKGLKLISPLKFTDDRGYFCETYNYANWQEGGIDCKFVQDNESCSLKYGTIRGLHFQVDPFAQDKLVRVVSGRVLDVAVDLRRSSETFGKYFSVELSSENGKQLFIPVGFAHGFVTLQENTHVFYKVTNYYSSNCDLGIAWDDPFLNIDWKVDKTKVTLSAKDRNLPILSEIDKLFK